MQRNNEDFSKKREGVFGALDELESAYSKRLTDRKDSDSHSHHPAERDDRSNGFYQQNTEFTRYRVDTNELERARQFRRARRNVPDYVRRPGSYTHYDLSDVADVTDSSNSQAAFAYLDEIRKRKQAAAAAKAASEESAESRPTFRKPKVLSQQVAADDDASFGSFSTKKKAKSDSDSSATAASKQRLAKSDGPSLSHLEEDDGDNDELLASSSRESSSKGASSGCTFRKSRTHRFDSDAK